MRKPSLRLGHAWLLCLSVACLSVVASSCGSGDSLITMGQYCSRIAGPLCNREITCGNIPSSELSYCTTEFQAGCCGDNNACGQAAPNEQAAMEIETVISECNTALSTASCTDLADGNPPVACGGTSTNYYVTPAAVTSAAVTATGANRAGAAAARRLAKQP
jgi:hypothetical protein